MSKPNRVVIRPELSAQGIRKRPNPMLHKVFDELDQFGLTCQHRPLIVDCGCGQLRNVGLLLSLSPRLVAVDTRYQLEHEHDFLGKPMTIPAMIEQQWPREQISVMSTEDFGKSSIDADVIFSINVLDVTPRITRVAMLRACRRNLKSTGLFVAIVPRNDAWTLRICTPEARHDDGYIFPHSRGHTYYRNWSGNSLTSLLKRRGFHVVQDLSTYRYACTICKKQEVEGARHLPRSEKML